jgi:hypothetical protein
VKSFRDTKPVNRKTNQANYKQFSLSRNKKKSNLYSIISIEEMVILIYQDSTILNLLCRKPAAGVEPKQNRLNIPLIDIRGSVPCPSAYGSPAAD